MNKKAVICASVTLLAYFALISCFLSNAEEVENKRICRYLSGKVEVNANIMVAENELLFVAEGSQFVFSENTGIIVKGELRVFGTAKKPVVFSGIKGKAQSGGIIGLHRASILVRHAVFDSCGIVVTADEEDSRTAIIRCDTSNVKLFSVQFLDSKVDSILDFQTCVSNNVIDRITIHNAEVRQHLIVLKGRLDVIEKQNRASNMILKGRLVTSKGGTPHLVPSDDDFCFDGLDTSELTTPVALICASITSSILKNLDVSSMGITNCQLQNCNVTFNRAYDCVFEDCHFRNKAFDMEFAYFDIQGGSNTFLLSSEEFLFPNFFYMSNEEWYVKTEDPNFVETCKKRLKGGKWKNGEMELESKYSLHKIQEGLYLVTE